MTELTKEKLIEEAKLKIAIAKCYPNSGMARVEGELFKIALASLEAKPIGAFHIAEQQVDGTSDYLKDGEWPIDNGIIEVYAVPPAPVPLTEVQRAMLHDMDVEISAELEEEEEIYRDGIRKCIAALRYHHKRAETCSNGYTGSTLEEDTLKSINFLKRNNIAAMLHGAEPVTTAYKLPDGWISCSERMPDDGQHVIILCDGAFVLYAQYRDGEFFDVVRNGDEFFETQSRNVTDWMPLPEPPQEV
ncbi:DUF551 domain-containing protein, partial [Escherichia coli O157:H7]|nr:DUF551 domain-containing protein [Escherichia coli O157:H7]